MFKNTSNYRNKIILLSVIQVLLLLAVLVWSVITGQYPLTLKSLLSGDTMSIMVFKTLWLLPISLAFPPVQVPVLLLQ